MRNYDFFFFNGKRFYRSKPLFLFTGNLEIMMFIPVKIHSHSSTVFFLFFLIFVCTRTKYIRDIMIVFIVCQFGLFTANQSMTLTLNRFRFIDSTRFVYMMTEWKPPL